MLFSIDPFSKRVMLQEKQFKREAACKISAAEILEGAFQQDETGSVALNIDGRLVKRVNLLATVISKPEDKSQAYESLIVDDGTAQLRLRFFDDHGLFKRADVGDFVTIIGRPRTYMEEVYLAPEIIKPNNNVKWAEARRLELELARRTMRQAGQPVVTDEVMAAPAPAANNGDSSRQGCPLKATDTLSEQQTATRPALADPEDAVSGEKIELYSLIKKLDTGRGADIGEVVAKSGMKDANRILEEMTKRGDIFEVLPGRLKVLE